MTQSNYTTKHRKNKHLTIKERAQIEMLLQQGKTKSEIARLIGIPRSTLYNELHRGTVDQMNTNLEVHQEYFAEAGQAIYEKHRENSRNPMLKKAIKRMDLPEYTTSINSLYFIDASSDTKRTLDELLRYCFDDYDCEAIIIKTAELGHNIGTDLINSKAKLRTFTAHSQAIIAESIYRKLTDDYGTKWTAAAFAEKYGVSESSIKNYFRNVYGYGFKEYQIKVRMKKAAEMLMNTDLSIKEIAAKVGYLSRAKFGEAFKNYYGISAPDYRNNAKAEKIASELAGE